MPNWHPPTTPNQEAVMHAIGEALHDLDLSGNPSFEDVVGMSFEEILTHADQALTALITSTDLKPDDPNVLRQIYLMGFVVGTKYGESRVSQ